MSRRMLVAVMAGLVSALVLGWLLRNHWQQFSQLRLENPWLLALLPGLVVAHIFTTGRLFDVLLGGLGLRLSWRESFGLAVLSRAANQLAPRGGTLLRATYLQRRHGCPLVDFLSITAASGVTNLLITVGLALLSVGWLGDRVAANFGVLVWGLAIVLGGLCCAALLAPPWALNLQKWPKVERALRGWRVIWGNRVLLTRSVALGLGQVTCGCGLTLIEFQILGISVSSAQALFLATAGSLHYLIRLTPAGLGVQEATLALAATVIGLPPASALLTVMLRRLTNISVLLLFTPWVSARWVVDWRQATKGIKAN